MMTGAMDLQAHEQSAVSPPRDLGWPRFLLQLVTVIAAFVAASIPPVVLMGEDSSVGMALSALASMVGGLAVAWLWLRGSPALGMAFNLARPQSWPRTIIIGVLAMAVIMAIFAVGTPVVDALGLDAPEVGEVIALVSQSPLTLLLWIVLVAWLSAAFGEELLWRGFLMDRLARLPGLHGRIGLVLVIHAVLFGLPHLYQGWGGVLVTGAIGLFLGWLRLRMNGNLWAPIIAHGLVDTIMLTLGYLEASG